MSLNLYLGFRSWGCYLCAGYRDLTSALSGLLRPKLNHSIVFFGLLFTKRSFATKKYWFFPFLLFLSKLDLFPWLKHKGIQKVTFQDFLSEMPESILDSLIKPSQLLLL